MKIVLQDGIKDCGICCLLSVTRYYGGDISKELLREMTNTNKSGVSAYNLIEAAKKIGFYATGVTGDMSKIEKNNLPCLAHVIINKSYKHFIVIYDINKDTKKITIMDPAKGKRKLTFSEFSLMTSSNYIFLYPLKKLPTISHKHTIKKLIKDFIKTQKKQLILIAILSIITFLLQIITSFHFKYLLEYAITISLAKPILVLSCYLLALYLLKELAILFRNIILMKCSSQIDYLITFKTYKHILLLPYLYYKNRTTGEVISRLKDLNIIKSFLIEICSILIIDLISIILFIILLLKLNKSLSIVVFIFSFVLLLTQLVFNKLNSKYKKKSNYHNDLVNSSLIESFSNIDVVKNNHLEKRFFDTFSLKYKYLLECNYNYIFITEVLSFFKNTINNFLLLMILGYGSYLVITKKLSLGDLIVYQSVFTYFLSSFSNILNFLNNIPIFKLAYSRLEDVFTIASEKFDGSYYYSYCKLDGPITFKNLTYEVQNKKLFNDLTLNITPGKRVLLTGKSGSGKSTLVKLLMRYLEVDYGFISINNIDINHYHLDVLRKNIVYVSNLDSLFTDTIYNNITLGRNILEEDFLKITSITGVDEIVNKDLGYQQLLEENGSNFSNGERQRIILARALIKNCDIYIFDEAFSQIDTTKTIKIMTKIFKYLQGKTIIVITHRFTEQNLFDMILKLENGVINEVKKL